MKCRYFCRLPLDISPVYLTRGISKPLNAPNRIAIKTEITVDSTPMISEILPPYQIMEKISLPNLSVPNQCSLFGACNAFFRSDTYGSCGAITGAKTATKIRRITNKKKKENCLFFFMKFNIFCITLTLSHSFVFLGLQKYKTYLPVN